MVEYASGDRFLERNEGQAVHSVCRRGSGLTGDIWDEYLIAPFTARTTPPRRIAILVDAYRRPYIPFYLATREFCALARERLTPARVALRLRATRSTPTTRRRSNG